jgi:hypothetical protein
MEASSAPAHPSTLPTRLQRFKDASIERSCLEARIQETIEKMKIVAVRRAERAEIELEEIRAKAVTVRSALKEICPLTPREIIEQKEILHPGPTVSIKSVPSSESMKREGTLPSPAGMSTVKNPNPDITSLRSMYPPVSPSSDDGFPVVDGPSSTTRSPIQGEPVPTDLTFSNSDEDEERFDKILELQAL